MSLPPVVERELRVAFRKRNPRRARVVHSLAAAGLTAAFILLGLIDPSWPRTLHGFLVLYALLSVFRALTVSSALFSEERRNQTLELLFLTGMTAPQLFATKLIGGLLIASSDLLAIMPFIAVPFLAGGLSLESFLATLVTLPVLLLFAIAIGVFASVLCSKDSTATLMAIGVLATLCMLVPVPYNLGYTLTGVAPFSSFWLSFSPAYAPWLMGRSFGPTFPPNFWAAIGITLGWTVVGLMAAAAILSRNWRNDPAQGIGFWRQRWELWVHGSKEWRLRLRHRLLDENPFLWRAEQDRHPTVLAWIVIAATAALWSLGWLAWRADWLTTTNLFATATVIIIAFYWLELQSASQHMARERSDNTLELLLTTPLQPQQIITALLDAPRSQLRQPRRLAFTFFIAMMLLGFFVRTWNRTAIVTYVIAWMILCWLVVARPRNTLIRAVWVALVSGRASYALLRIHGASYAWLIPLSYNFYRAAANFGNAAAQFPKGTVTEVCIVAFVGLVVLIVAFVARERSELFGTLLGQMRTIAQQPIPDPDDPRFKKWTDIKQPFPSAE